MARDTPRIGPAKRNRLLDSPETLKERLRIVGSPPGVAARHKDARQQYRLMAVGFNGGPKCHQDELSKKWSG